MQKKEKFEIQIAIVLFTSRIQFTITIELSQPLYDIQEPTGKEKYAGASCTKPERSSNASS